MNPHPPVGKPHCTQQKAPAHLSDITESRQTSSKAGMKSPSFLSVIRELAMDKVIGISEYKTHVS